MRALRVRKREKREYKRLCVCVSWICILPFRTLNSKSLITTDGQLVAAPCGSTLEPSTRTYIGVIHCVLYLPLYWLLWAPMDSLGTLGSQSRRRRIGESIFSVMSCHVMSVMSAIRFTYPQNTLAWTWQTTQHPKYRTNVSTIKQGKEKQEEPEETRQTE